MNLIKDTKEIILNESERKIAEKGWGIEVLQNVTVKKIIYNSDGYDVEGYIAEPIDKTKTYPLIIWNRGGDEKSGRLDNFLAAGILGEISSWGYVVLASQYRTNDEFGGKEINDILNILKIGMSLSSFDGENVGVEGWSRGGMMTYQLLTKINFLKCAVIVAGLADLESNFKHNEKLKNKFYSIYGNKSENKIKEEIVKRSAVEFYFDINPEIPMLLIHGTSDEKVLYSDSKSMYEKLTSIERAEVKLETIENGDHYLRKERKEVMRIRRDWFDKYLKLNK